MADKPIPEVIMIKRSLAESIASDVVTLVMALSLVGIGVLVESTAMQWVGAIIFFITVSARTKRLMNDNRFTIPQARAKLDELEAGQ